MSTFNICQPKANASTLLFSSALDIWWTATIHQDPWASLWSSAILASRSRRSSFIFLGKPGTHDQRLTTTSYRQRQGLPVCLRVAVTGITPNLGSNSLCSLHLKYFCVIIWILENHSPIWKVWSFWDLPPNRPSNMYSPDIEVRLQSISALQIFQLHTWKNHPVMFQENHHPDICGFYHWKSL